RLGHVADQAGVVAEAVALGEQGVLSGGTAGQDYQGERGGAIEMEPTGHDLVPGSPRGPRSGRNGCIDRGDEEAFANSSARGATTEARGGAAVKGARQTSPVNGAAMSRSHPEEQSPSGQPGSLGLFV